MGLSPRTYVGLFSILLKCAVSVLRRGSVTSGSVQKFLVVALRGQFFLYVSGKKKTVFCKSQEEQHTTLRR